MFWSPSSPTSDVHRPDGGKMPKKSVAFELPSFAVASDSSAPLRFHRPPFVVSKKKKWRRNRSNTQPDVSGCFSLQTEGNAPASFSLSLRLFIHCVTVPSPGSFKRLLLSDAALNGKSIRAGQSGPFNSCAFITPCLRSRRPRQQ